METQPGSSPEAGSSSLTVGYNEEAEDDDSVDFKSTQESKEDEHDDLPPSYDDIIHNRTSGIKVCHEIFLFTQWLHTVDCKQMTTCKWYIIRM